MPADADRSFLNALEGLERGTAAADEYEGLMSAPCYGSCCQTKGG